jgi:predicted GTPase
MGYSDRQLRELERTIDAVDCDVVVSATPIDLTRLVDCRHPVRHATYELEEVGRPALSELLAPIVARAAVPEALR